MALQLLPQFVVHVFVQPPQPVPHDLEQLFPQLPEQLPWHPLQLLLQVPRHSPVHAPRQLEELPVIDSFARLSTWVSNPSLKEDGIAPPSTIPSIFKSPWSHICNNGLITFIPCSAYITLPLAGECSKFPMLDRAP